MIYQLRISGVLYTLSHCERNTPQVWSGPKELGKLKLIGHDWHVTEIEGKSSDYVFIYDHRLSGAIKAIEATLNERVRSKVLLSARQQYKCLLIADY